MTQTSMAATAHLLAIGAARTVPLVLTIPVAGGPAMPLQLRLGLGLGLSVLCLPSAAGIPEVGSLAWSVLAAREALVGLVMGFVVACTFRAAEAAGALTDVLRGAGPSWSPSPVGEGRSSPLGALLLLMAAMVFLEMGGVGHVASALARSYEAIPIGVSLHPQPARAAAVLAIIASGKLIEAAIGLAAPAMVAILLADLALGLLGRAVPRLPIYPVGPSLRALVGIGAVWLSLGAMELALQSSIRGFFTLLARTFRLGS